MIKTSLSLFSLPTLFLLTAVPAQEPKAPAPEAKPAVATGNALVVRTANADMAERVADMFAYEGGDMPKVGSGECFVMTLGGDGKLTIAAEKAPPVYLQVRARPAILAEIFADKVQEAQENVGMFAGMAAMQFGMSAQELTAFINDVFAFPKQLDTINIDMRGSESEGIDGKVEVLPVGSGWFAKFVGELQPNKLGAPVVQDADALMSFAANLDNAALVKAAQPFLGFVVGAGSSDKDEKKKYAATVQEMLTQFDGTLSMVMGAEGKGQKVLAGLLDGKKVASLVDSADFKAWRQASAEANPMAEVDLVEKAITHRDVACNKQVTDVSMPNGQSRSTTQFSGVAGSYLFAAGDEADTKSVIDTILDQKITRGALPGNALLTASIKIAEMVRSMSGGMADGDGAPAKLDVAMGKQGSGLNITFKVGM